MTIRPFALRHYANPNSNRILLESNHLSDFVYLPPFFPPLPNRCAQSQHLSHKLVAPSIPICTKSAQKITTPPTPHPPTNAVSTSRPPLHRPTPSSQAGYATRKEHTPISHTLSPCATSCSLSLSASSDYTPTDQLTNRPTNQPTNRPTDQPTIWTISCETPRFFRLTQKGRQPDATSAECRCQLSRRPEPGGSRAGGGGAARGLKPGCGKVDEFEMDVPHSPSPFFT